MAESSTMPEYSLETLLQFYFDNQLTKEQEQELFALISAGTHDEEIKLFMDRSWSRLATHDALPDAEKKAILRSIFNRQSHRVHFLRTAWFRYVAAAIVLFVVGSLWFVVDRRGGEKPVVVQTPVDIAPGREGAVLTLADGKTIVLDSMANGIVAQQNGSDIELSNGKLQYATTHSPLTTDHSPAYNTLSTPRGRQFQLALPDGTKVWLNAASSIRYPTVFTSRERRVQITGEAYFEVSKDKLKPFLVDVDGKQTVEVLGTHFNINSYADEDAIRTTLLEGKVKVSATQPETRNPKPQTVLNPGQQARLTGGQLQVHAVDTADVVAWVRGQLSMENVDIKTLMRQVSRWYDVDVEFRGDMPDKHFFGMIDRNASYLSGIIQVLEANGLQVTRNGRTIIIISNK